MSDHTWRDVIPTSYLSKDHFNKDEVRNLTIKSAARELVEDPVRRSTKECLVLHFAEPGILPMVCNATNARMITRISGSNALADWPGNQIAVYVDRTVKVGKEIVGGLRVKPCTNIPRSIAAIPCGDCGGKISGTGTVTADQVADGTTKKYGVALCLACVKKRKDASNAAE